MTTELPVPERDILVNALIAEVLGPRRGAWEHLAEDEDPLDEYISGVLAPRDAGGVTMEVDAEDEPVAADDPAADDQADPGVPSANLGLTVPALDPRLRPASLGLSFSVASDGSPRIDICCTWGRYEQEADGWSRSPRIAQWDGVECLSGNQVLEPASDSGVDVVVRTRRRSDGWRVSVFLVDKTPCTEDEHPRAPKHVFQPQIRVNCAEGTRIIPTDDLPSAEDWEDVTLAFLYRQHRSFARGHLCSAVWREIDPERAAGGGPDAEGSPFRWIDGQALLDATELARFSPADVRTEYVPMVAVPAPLRDWQAEGQAPELHPDRLSELWDGAELHRALRPLIDGYDSWINRRLTEAQRLADGDRAVAHEQIAGARDALRRMGEGLDLLRDNDDARLAFCFANRAIALQSRWTRGTAIAWYPFQLAFQLLNLRAVADSASNDRGICDLLWFPTGGGKTEAYLGLAAFALAHRRLTGTPADTPVRGAGTAVLSRYTLRLLTIQQFRRALTLVTAAELLRVTGPAGQRGWRPEGCGRDSDNLWGDARFSIGLWVGGGVTPNGLQDIDYIDRNRRPQRIPGAISLLEGRSTGDTEPAQVLSCPACSTVLALPRTSPAGEPVTLRLLFGDVTVSRAPSPTALSTDAFAVQSATLLAGPAPGFGTISIEFTPTNEVAPANVDVWIRDHVRPLLGASAWLLAARGSRPGYVIREAPWGQRAPLRNRAIDFEIYCPNPECELNAAVMWWENTPTGAWPIPEPFQTPSGGSRRCPIPAYTVDEQIYQRCPSMVIATVDKFARLAFEERASSIFGNVEWYNQHLGYYRAWCPSMGPSSGLPQRPAQDPPVGGSVPVPRFSGPDLILQDELHLIEGPLGSMVGLYETAIEALSIRAAGGAAGRRPKYVASTATVRRAGDQVQSLFLRELRVFPPPGLSADDSFFARLTPAHPAEASLPGRLHIGICAPGRGAQTPIVRIWSRLLQHAQERLTAGAPAIEIDRFWTLVGYFNAIRELASAVALFRQDIVQRMSSISAAPRALEETEPLELSSRADSLSLPGMLDQLAASLGGTRQPINAVAATSMFGTGVDVDRLGLMVVQGQPKTTSSYIQATGRVGRSGGGLVVTFHRASRPRDLNHYEFFSAYHAAQYRHVEPVTVNPFSPRARDRALGPVAVALLRQAHQIVMPGTPPVPVHAAWRMQQRLRGAGAWASRADRMATARNDADVNSLPRLFEMRAQAQPGLRRPAPSDVDNHAGSELDRWQQLALRVRARLLYHESTLVNPASRPVVLGDLAHTVAGTGQAYEDAPNSLREVEATTTFQGWRR